MPSILIAMDEATIERDGDFFAETAVVLDRDRDIVAQFPVEWTDEQIRFALGLANRVHQTAFAAGWDARLHFQRDQAAKEEAEARAEAAAICAEAETGSDGEDQSE